MSLKHCCALMLVASLCLAAPVRPANAKSLAQNESVRASPNEALRAARTIFIRTKSVYFKPTALENSLLQQDEFQQWEMAITRDETDADLIIEVGRKVFTTNFIYSVLDPKTNRVIASGRVNSIGGTVEGKITDSFMKKLRAARQTTSRQSR
ncbi:MAG TPA: hypothetical protein VGC89_17335 [Pyrinomonadaceae bacterium]